MSSKYSHTKWILATLTACLLIVGILISVLQRANRMLESEDPIRPVLMTKIDHLLVWLENGGLVLATATAVFALVWLITNYKNAAKTTVRDSQTADLSSYLKNRSLASKR